MSFKTKKVGCDYRNGQIMLITAIFFMALSLVISFGLTNPIIKQSRVALDLWKTKESYYISEAGAEDVIYRIKGNMAVSSGETLNLNGFEAVTNISDSVDGKTVNTESDRGGYIKKIETKIKKGIGASFIYGLQTGQGGFSLSGSSKIIGNVYSNGPIVGCGSCSITGSAVSANGVNLTSDQHNEVPSTPPNSIVFGNTNGTQDLAQSFKISSTSPITQASFLLKKIGSPANITVKIIRDHNGSPSSQDVLASGSLSSSLVTNNYGWIEVPFSSNPSLVIGTQYWLVMDTSSSGNSQYIIGANLDSNYLNGTSKTGRLGVSWNDTGLDSYFKIYLGGSFGNISGEGQNNKLSVGTEETDEVYAHHISYVDATGEIKCQIGISNNKVCDTSYPDPAPAPYPISDANIESWKEEGFSGDIINGNYSISGSNNISLGPKKIIGNLTVSGSGVLTMTGTIYVTGDVIISGSGKIQLASSYGSNSGVLVSDGRVNIPGSGSALGSGQSGSYLLIVTTSDCPSGGSCGGQNAIEMSGSGGAVILNAQKGTINFNGSARANEATANRITMDGGSIVTYQEGLVNQNFSNGPSGGFNIIGWKELEY